MSVDQRSRNEGGWALPNVPYLWFLLPGLIAYTVLFIYPTIRSFYLSLYDWSGRGPFGPIVWEQNFRALLHSDKFWQAAGNSFRLFIFIFICVFQDGHLFKWVEDRTYEEVSELKAEGTFLINYLKLQIENLKKKSKDAKTR